MNLETFIQLPYKLPIPKSVEMSGANSLGDKSNDLTPYWEEINYLYVVIDRMADSIENFALEVESLSTENALVEMDRN
jgi:hypothetical protein